MLTVVCWMWHDPRGRHNHLYRYDARYVNALRSMLSRHLSMQHELVCVTDDPGDIDPRVRVMPTPDDVRDWPGHLRRLAMFRPDAAQVFGGERLLLIDLDVVILRSIDPIVDRPEDFVSWEPRLYYALHGKYSRYNTGFVLMDAGARPQVWDRFSVERAQHVLGNMHEGVVDEQSWISHVLGPDEPVWSWRGDVVSIKAVPNPEKARIVFFNGPRAPGMESLQREYPWITENWH
jgi:hypothetical protein